MGTLNLKCKDMGTVSYAKSLVLLVAFSALSFNNTPINTPADAEDGTISVMTFNVRYDNPGDAPNHWANRRDWVGALIRYYQPDFVGTQEVMHHQLMEMKERLPEYEYLGVGRDDGKQGGEYSAIFYKKSKYDLIRSATFWLSENPERVGEKGWDADYPRVVSWGEFKNKANGKKLFVFNTHFDHKGALAREESAKLLLKKVSEIAGNTEAIITGDFNASPESSVYERLTKGNNNHQGLFDTYALSSAPYGPEWTFHGFGKTPVAERKRIDYILTNKKVKVARYHAIAEQRGEVFPSDHLPVFTEISFK